VDGGAYTAHLACRTTYGTRPSAIADAGWRSGRKRTHNRRRLRRPLPHGRDTRPPAGEAPITHHVNGIAGYSAFWITGETEYYRHTGSLKQLESVHDGWSSCCAIWNRSWTIAGFTPTRRTPRLMSTGLRTSTAILRIEDGTHFEFYAGFRDASTCCASYTTRRMPMRSKSPRTS